MSQKSVKRSRRRTDEEMSSDFKAPSSPVKESEKVEDSTNNTNGVDDEAGNLKGFVAVKESNENVDACEVSPGPKTRSRSNTPQSKKEQKCTVEAKENGITEVVVSERNQNDKLDSQDGADTEIEPLVLDPEEPEPELQFDENSEPESRKDSPVLGRCKTRRSQTRNIPTPKTPKSPCDNYEDKVPDDVPPMPTVSETTDTEIGETTIKEVFSTNEETFSIEKEDSECLDNLSTKVEVGGDTTRNAEFNSYEEEATEQSSYISTSKDRTLGGTLRNLSSRRPIRSSGIYQRDPVNSVKHVPLKPEIQANISFRPSMERIPGVKRRNRSETPENLKRKKTDSAGFLSYIASPITNIKSKMSKADVASSTPKLTSYKSSIFEKADVSKITTDHNEDAHDERKWCVVM